MLFPAMTDAPLQMGLPLQHRVQGWSSMGVAKVGMWP